MTLCAAAAAATCTFSFCLTVYFLHIIPETLLKKNLCGLLLHRASAVLGALVAVWYSAGFAIGRLQIQILARLYFTPWSTQPSIPPGSVNEYHLGRQRQVWLIRLADETQGVQVKLCYPLTTCAIPGRLRDALCGGAGQIDYLYLLYLY